jgi:2-hydroxychromene-2-carboxylate isomerase
MQRETRMATIELFFDYGSPASYLAYTQMPGIAQRTGAQVIYRPMLLGGVFKATGNQSPVAIPAKGAWMMTDLPRFAKRYGVPYVRNPHFPINTLNLMRGAIAAEIEGRLIPYSDAIFRAIWVDQKRMEDPIVIGGVLREAGFDPAAMMAAIGTAAVKDKLKASTEEAVARGVFGAPTCFVGDAMFFGQDRLDFVEEEAKRAA